MPARAAPPGGALLALVQGERGVARELVERALAAFRAARDRAGVARALANLGRAAIGAGDGRAAERHLAEAVAIQRELGRTPSLSRALSRLAYVVAERGRYAEARRLLDEATEIRRETDPASLPSLLLVRSAVELDAGAREAARAAAKEAARGFAALVASGEGAAARPHLERATETPRALGLPRILVACEAALSDLARAAGDRAAARAHHEGALAIARPIESRVEDNDAFGAGRAFSPAATRTSGSAGGGPNLSSIRGSCPRRSPGWTPTSRHRRSGRMCTSVLRSL